MQIILWVERRLMLRLGDNHRIRMQPKHKQRVIIGCLIKSVVFDHTSVYFSLFAACQVAGGIPFLDCRFRCVGVCLLF